ncbi:MAG TPA: methyl-accepting chemotaxis protein, partial [Synergistaceae bacterium]|nr:methyl-accepting chemotaxis protein [Synergistaceae bacterium]
MAFWDDLRMGKKLALGFGAVAAIGLALGLGGLYGISRLSRELEFVGKNRIPDLRSLADLNYLRMEARSQAQAVIQAEGDHRVEDITALRKDREVAFQKIDAAWKALVSVPRHTEKGRQILALLKVQYGGWRDQHRGIDQLLDRLALSSSGDRRQDVLKQYRAAMDHLIPLSDAMGETVVSLVENNNAVTAQLVEDDLAMAEWIKSISAVFTGVGLAMTILLGWAITRGISVPIGVGVSLMARMSRGDLTRDVPPEFLSRGDEIGDLARAVQELTEDLRLQVSALKDATAVLGATSSQIAAS